jgi:hypothetical protein
MALDMPSADLYDTVTRGLANRAVAALVVVCPASVAVSTGLPIASAALGIVDTPRKDERDIERQLLARDCGSVLDIAAFPLTPADLVRHARECLARHEAAEKPAEPRPATIARVNRKLRAGDVELDVLRFQEITSDPAVFAIVRNSSYLLPYFLDHYRSLGVTQFVIFDDQSTDGTRERLLDQPDVMVLGSTLRFHHRMPNGKQLHHNLRNWMPESLGPGRWAITVDADEFMMLPAAAPTIPKLVEYLDSRGHGSALASMIDFYPRTLAERNHARTVSPFEASPFFDLSKGFVRNAAGEIEKAPGGIRWRLQEWLRSERPEVHQRIYAGQGYERASSWKTPFVKVGRGTWMINSHSTNTTPPMDLELALAHFKFHPDIDRTVADALATNSHYLQSIEYHFMKAALAAFGDRDLLCGDTRRFEGPASLEAAGLSWIRP